MTETHTPEPTHIVEVYLQADITFGIACRTDRYFYADATAAEASYGALVKHLAEAQTRGITNVGVMVLEVDDFYGKGTLVVRDLRGVRLFASAELDAFDDARTARKAGAVAAAKHRATEAS